MNHNPKHSAIPLLKLGDSSMPKKKKAPATEGVQTGVSETVVFGIMMWRLRDTLPDAHEIDPGTRAAIACMSGRVVPKIIKTVRVPAKFFPDWSINEYKL